MNDVALVVLDTLRNDIFDEHFDWLPGRRFENAWSPSHWTGAVHASLFTGLYPGEAGTFAHNRTFDHPEPVLPERLRDAGYATRAFSCNVIVSSEFGFDRGFETYDGSWNVERALTDGEVFDWHTLLRDDQSPATYLQGLRQSIGDDCDTLPSLRRGLALATGRRALDYGARRAVDTLGSATFPHDSFLYVNLMEAHAPYRPPPQYRTVDDYETPDHPLYAAPGSDVTGSDVAGSDATEFDTTEFDAAAPDANDGADPDAGPPVTTGSAAGDDATADGGRADDAASGSVGEGEFDPAGTRQAYHDGVRYLSATYRELFSRLRESFDYVITVGDHGEMFGEHGYYEHTYGIYPEATHVPLVVSGDDVADERRAETVSLLDVHRTIAARTGVDAPGRGQDLLDDPESRTYLTEYRGIPHPRQVESLTDRGVPADRIRRYDESLFGIAFPDGTYAYQTPAGLRTRGDPEVADPESRLREHLDDLDVREGGDDPADISAGVVDRLEHLGYV